MRAVRLFVPLAAAIILGCPILTALAQSPAAPPQVWQLQSSGTTASLRGIDAVDATVAWASGSGGTVLRTTDGGAHWESCVPPKDIKDWSTLDFRGIQAWDSATAMVMASGPGDSSRLYETEDACASWKLVFKNPDSPKGFFDSFWLNTMYGEGILLGDPVDGGFAVFVTQDGGRTWKRDHTPGLSHHGDTIAAFAASNSSIARNGTQFLRGFITGGKGGAFLFQRWGGPIYRRYRIQLMPPRVADAAWSDTSLPLASGSDGAGGFSLGYRLIPSRCRECKLGPDWHFVAVGGDYTKPNATAGTAAWSSDGGIHWTASSPPPHGYRSAVQWSENIKAWITAGTNGSDISRDDGQTWQPLDNGNWNALSLPFAVGPNGRIARLDPKSIPKP